MSSDFFSPTLRNPPYRESNRRIASCQPLNGYYQITTNKHRLFMQVRGWNAHPNGVEKQRRGPGLWTARFARRTGDKIAGVTDSRFFIPFCGRSAPN